MGETLGETVGEGCKGTEGNRTSAFPVHREACWAPGPNPLLLEPPSCHAEPKPHCYTSTQCPTTTLGDPLQLAGPKPHPHTRTQGPTSKLRNSTLQRPSF